MKVIKWLLVGLVGLVLTVLAVAAAALALLDVNRFKPEIEQSASELLGRQLSIEGEITKTLFPWLGVSVGRVVLANAEGFGDTPFASIESAAASVKILPLLQRKITIGNLELAGLTLDAQLAADGNSNIPRFDSGSEEPAEDAGEASPDSAISLPEITIDGVSLSGANIRYRDAESELDAQITDVNLSIGNVRDGQTSPLTGRLDLSVQPYELSATAELDGKLTPTFSAMQFLVDELNLQLDASGDAVPGGQRAVALSGAAEVDLNAGTATLSGFEIKSGNASARLDVDVESLNTSPTVNGRLTIPSMDLGALLDELDLSAGPMQREDALSAFSLDATLEYAANSASLESLTIKLDDTALSGAAVVSELDAAMPAVEFELTVDQLDVDHYLPPTGDDASAVQTGADASGDTAIPLPTELLRTLRLQGKADVSSLTAANLTMQNIAVELVAADGVLAVDSMNGALYQGNIDANASLDVSGDTPHYSATATLTGVQAQPLLTDFAEFDKLLGSGEINLDLETSGESVAQLSAGLGGAASFSFLDGAIDGINIAAQLRKLLSAIGQAEASESEEPLRTDFAKFSASATIAEGVVQNTDLDLRSPLLRLAGQGSVSLPGEQIDYLLKPALVSSLEGQGGANRSELSGLKFDLPIVGSFTEIAEDFPGVLRRGLSDGVEAAAKADLEAKKAALEAEAKAKLEAREAELKARAEQEKDRAKTKLEESANEKIDEVKEKLEDRLKKLF